jgi:hypothetical protein
MHIDKATKNYFLEVDIAYNPNDFLELFDRYELEMYIDRNGEPFGLEVCYDTRLLQEPVVQHYINVFKDFGLRIGYDRPSANEKHSGVAGYQLARSQLKDRGLAIHKDGFRNSNITFPVSLPQHINWYADKQGNGHVRYDYRDKIVFCNVGGAWHSVDPSAEPRLQFQFDCYIDWELIPDLIEKI